MRSSTRRRAACWWPPGVTPRRPRSRSGTPAWASRRAPARNLPEFYKVPSARRHRRRLRPRPVHRGPPDADPGPPLTRWPRGRGAARCSGWCCGRRTRRPRPTVRGGLGGPRCCRPASAPGAAGGVVGSAPVSCPAGRACGRMVWVRLFTPRRRNRRHRCTLTVCSLMPSSSAISRLEAAVEHHDQLLLALGQLVVGGRQFLPDHPSAD